MPSTTPHAGATSTSVPRQLALRFTHLLLISLLTASVATTVAIRTAEAQTPSTKPGPWVSTTWLAQHLTDARVRIVATGNRADYDRGHIPGATFIEHDDTLDMSAGRHRIKPPQALAEVLEAAGIADDVHVILYGDAPMTTGWIYTAIALVGHAADVSMLDGSMVLWREENRSIATAPSKPVRGRLTLRSPGAHAVDAAWVREHLGSPDLALLDVRTPQEWDAGRLPGGTPILWQDLFEDLRTLKWKSPDQLRSLLTRAGVKPGQRVVTYCAVGMRASLMAWAVRALDLPASVYMGSWQDWQSNPTHEIVR